MTPIFTEFLDMQSNLVLDTFHEEHFIVFFTFCTKEKIRHAKNTELMYFPPCLIKNDDNLTTPTDNIPIKNIVLEVSP